MTGQNKGNEILSLGDFVASTITEIARGLDSIKNAGDIEDLLIFPESAGQSGLGNTTTVCFDLAVTARTAASKENQVGGGIGGNIGVLLGKISGSTSEGKNTEASTVNRIQFEIKVHFPASKVRGTLGTRTKMGNK